MAKGERHRPPQSSIGPPFLPVTVPQGFPTLDQQTDYLTMKSNSNCHGRGPPDHRGVSRA